MHVHVRVGQLRPEGIEQTVDPVEQGTYAYWLPGPSEGGAHGGRTWRD
jgi:hypothetical protein